MKKITQQIATLLTTAWIGGLWSIGYLAAPILFHAQPDKQLAGLLAGHMFTGVSYLGLVCGSYLLVYYKARPSNEGQKITLIIACMLLIAIIILFVVQPMIAQAKLAALPLEVMQSSWAGKFKALHGASQILYLTQSMLAGYWLILSNPIPKD